MLGGRPPFGLQFGENPGSLEIDLKGADLWEVGNFSIASVVNIGRTVGGLPVEITGRVSFLDSKAVFLKMGFYLLEVADIFAFLMFDDGEVRVTVMAELNVDDWFFLFPLMAFLWVGVLVGGRRKHHF